MRILSSIFATATLCGAACLAGHAARADSPVVAETEQGVVIGKAMPTDDVFLGIPFASPPTGQLRFRDPVPPGIRSAPLLATTPAPGCLQPVVPGSGLTVSENCLTLDIYQPRRATGRRPVMVWIYGGGFINGSSSMYDGSALSVAGNVVVVAINYRLGAFGFLAPSALAAAQGGRTGNFGIADQTEALRWIRRNISHFGGDPNRVTIFGESAGGVSVCGQLVSPAAAGLFGAAISQSGACGLSLATLAAAEPTSDAIVNALGCGGAGDVGACLRALPASTIQNSAPANLGGLLPVIDGQIIPRSFNDAVTTDHFNKVPVLFGGTHDEGTVFTAQIAEASGGTITAPVFAGLLQELFGANASLVAAEYPLSAYSSPMQDAAAVVGDSQLICPTSTSELELAARVPTFAYEYNEPDPPAVVGFPTFPDFNYGDAHGDDVLYLFPNTATAADKTPAFLALSAVFMRDWAAFATYRIPDTLQSSGSPWYPLLPAFDDVESLQDRPRMEFNLRPVHHCGFWDKLSVASNAAVKETRLQ